MNFFPLDALKLVVAPSRRNNLLILGIKGDPRETWEDCEKKIYDLLEEKLEMDLSNNITIERGHHVGEKSSKKERAVVVQFSFYKDNVDILKNCKKKFTREDKHKHEQFSDCLS